MRNIAWRGGMCCALVAGCAVAEFAVHAAYAQPCGRGRQRPYLPMVVIDPGHGGIDPGAIGASSVYENTSPMRPRPTSSACCTSATAFSRGVDPQAR